MLRILRLLIALVLLTSPLWLLVLALDPEPRVLETAALGVDDVENAKRLLRENDPRWLRDGERKRVVLSERELNLMLRYALPASSGARIALAPELVSVATSTAVPVNLLGSHLNVDVILAQNGAAFEPIAMSAGSIDLPAWMARGLAGLGDRLLRVLVPEYGTILESVESIRVDAGSLALTYRWRAGLLEQLRDRGQELVMSEAQRERVLVYYASIARLAPTLQADASLIQLLAPLFAEAGSRDPSGIGAAEENRAVILALGMALRGVDVRNLAADGDIRIPRITFLPVSLRGRRDLAQHFGISAAIAAGGGSRLADAIGVFKELSDSRGGSGFSFPDLLADRAGVVFADQATGSGAQRIQQQLAGAGDEALLMPPIDQLPEGLQDLEFRSRYDDLDTEAYRRIENEVERRIEALALYRE